MDIEITAKDRSQALEMLADIPASEHDEDDTVTVTYPWGSKDIYIFKGIGGQENNGSCQSSKG